MPKPAGYSASQIMLHWMIAALVIFQLLFGESMTNFVDGRESGEAVNPTDATLATGHYWVGIAILVLVALRLVLRFAAGAPEPSGSGVTRKLAHTAHLAFYVLLLAVPATGLLAYYGVDVMGDVHGWAKPVFIALIAIHAGAALVHQFMLRDGTLQRMLRPSL